LAARRLAHADRRIHHRAARALSLAALDLIEPFEPDVSKWDAWHPAEAARRLAGVDAPWAVVAGWSLDLFRGRQTREHEDLEIAVPARTFPAIAEALSEFEHFVVGDGYARPVSAESLAGTHQTWVRERETGLWRLDVMREPWDGDTWICRRDPSIRRPGSEVIAHTADGIPYQQPEIALLFKAKAVRPKDEADFAAMLPLLEDSRRRWLAEALELVHPGHAWLAALTG
jgi:hypothetical protein